MLTFSGQLSWTCQMQEGNDLSDFLSNTAEQTPARRSICLTSPHMMCTGSAVLRIVIVPGNPGQASYYLPVISHLHGALGGKADVFAISHMGHGIGCDASKVCECFPS